MSTPASRIRAFLNVYPHRQPTNVDPDVIYSYHANGEKHEVTWDDLDSLVRDSVELESLRYPS